MFPNCKPKNPARYSSHRHSRGSSHRRADKINFYEFFRFQPPDSENLGIVLAAQTEITKNKLDLSGKVSLKLMKRYVNFRNYQARSGSQMTSVTSLFAPIDQDLCILADNLTKLVSARHPILAAAAEHLFSAGGKRVRPAIVLLIARGTMPNLEITPRHRRLAEITEMIHTASLVHDDIVDQSELRRQVPTVNSLFDNRIAVLAGDFLFAQSSWYLANLDNLEVVKLLSEVIRDFAEGEIQQGLNRFDSSLSIEAYLEKSYYKTASLLANSGKAAGILSGVTHQTAVDLYLYGKNLGLAFQIVDDILDFTSSTEVLGKPAGSDLVSGNITAPAIYALEEKPYLEVLIEREFSESGDPEEAIALVKESHGIERARELAAHHGKLALQNLECLKPSPCRQALAELTDYILGRVY